MADEQKTINWNSIVTNAVSMLVAAVFVGAAVIVWKAATTIDDKIDAATTDIKAQYITMTEEITSLHTEIRKLRSQLDSHDVVLRNKSTASSLSKDKPLILPKYKLSDRQLSERRKEDAERILNVYRKNRSEIQRR